MHHSKLAKFFLPIILFSLFWLEPAQANPHELSFPLLADIRIDSQGAELRPAFASDVRRYSIYPDAVSQPLQVTVTPNSPDDVVTVNGELLPAGGGTVALPSLQDGQKIPILVTNAVGFVSRYELVYVPAVFPKFEVLSLTPKVAPGYLFVTFRLRRRHFVAVIDNYGVPVFLKEESNRVVDFKMHSNGQFSYYRRNGVINIWGRATGEQVVLSDSFSELGAFQTVGLTHTDDHDFLILPNGNHVFLAYEGSIRDLSNEGGSSEEIIEDSVVQEVDSFGNVVFEWNSAQDIPLEDALRWLGNDYAHANSLDTDEQGNILVSLRGTSQVVNIDRSTGELIWKLGGLSSDFIFEDDPLQGICGQHTALWLQNGNLVLFDNGFQNPDFCPPGPTRFISRVTEYELDEEAMTAKLVWSYDDGVSWARALGSIQPLRNGNRLIGWGSGPDKLATEVDIEKEVLYEVRATNNNGQSVASYRVLRFELDTDHDGVSDDLDRCPNSIIFPETAQFLGRSLNIPNRFIRTQPGCSINDVFKMCEAVAGNQRKARKCIRHLIP